MVEKVKERIIHQAFAQREHTKKINIKILYKKY